MDFLCLEKAYLSSLNSTFQKLGEEGCDASVLIFPAIILKGIWRNSEGIKASWQAFDTFATARHAQRLDTQPRE